MGTNHYIPSDLEEAINKPDNLNFSLLEFPFKSKLSFVPLYHLYKHQLKTGSQSFLYLQEDIVNTMEQVQELLLPIEDRSLLKKYHQTVDLIMATVIPVAELDSAMSLVAAPYDMMPIFATPRFKEFFDFGQFDKKDLHAMIVAKTYNAYRLILEKFYNRKISVDKPMVVTFLDEENGLKKYFKLSINESLCEVVSVGDIPDIGDKEIDELINNFWDLNRWMELIPPDLFQFHGMVVMSFHEVTEQEALSDLRLQLLESSSVITGQGFDKLESSLRDYFSLPELKLGLMSFTGEDMTQLEIGRKICNSILHDLDKMQCTDFSGSPYEQAFTTMQAVAISDTEKIDGALAFKQALQNQGIKSMLVAPLIHENKFIGILEIASSEVNDINEFSLFKVKQLVSLFSIAVQRSLEELASQIETIIREEYTAIHPTVAWKFKSAANAILDARFEGREIDTQPIIFEDVYPLYGMSDIRNSSVERSNAIQHDLIEHLNLADSVIDQSLKQKELPILQHIKYRIDKKRKKVEQGLRTGDETSILEFIRKEVEPVFDHLVSNQYFLGDSLHKYKTALSKEYGTLYRKRKEFEESLTRINHTLSGYLDVENEKAQEIYPHYFEKYKTDGVEYNIYIGDSIVPNKQFDELLLRNIRLWQLKTMCEVAKVAEDLKESLSIPLETTHLILVQSNPLSIRFRQDEKKFDVDGAYNVRYEIVKKRIDKAFIKGTRERLTQPGMIAIVYSQSRERDEYKQYIEYLQSQDYLSKNIEEVELEELQGASGLKALRVRVNTGEDVAIEQITEDNLKLAISKMVG